MRRAETPRPTRRLGGLMLLSALLHGGVFLFIAGSRPASPQPLPMIVATLRLAQPSNNAVSAAASAPATPLPKVRRLPAATANPPVPRPQANARPANDAPPATRPTAVPVSGASSDTAPGPALAAPAVAATETTPGSAPSAVASAPAALAAYRQQLSALLAQQRSYPRLAAMRGWEGEVRLRLRVARRGNLVAVEVERSSGFDILDQHARALLAALGDLPPPPGEGGEIQVVVPINYKLDRTT